MSDHIFRDKMSKTDLIVKILSELDDNGFDEDELKKLKKQELLDIIEEKEKE